MMRSLAAATLATALTCTGCSDETTPDLTGHNVILITFDALRADHLGAYGYERNTSPHLDRFAAEAHVFTDAMCQSGSTLASLPSMMTSKFPVTDEIMQYGEHVGLMQKEVTLAEILKEHGYHTASVVNNRFAGAAHGMDQGFDICSESTKEEEDAAATCARALAVMEQLESPFFLWVHFIEPHAPYRSSDEVFDEFYQAEDGEPTLQRDSYKDVLAHFSKTEKVVNYRIKGQTADMTPTMIEQTVARYDGNIRRADDAFAKLMERIDGSEAGKRSVIIVGADHGESMGEHGIFDHNALFWGILNTPIMVRLPDRSHAMRRYPVMNVDIPPTVLSLLQIEVPGDMRGRNLFDDQRDDYYQLAEYDERMTIKIGRFRALNTGERKALYDVVADPNETENVIAKHPDVAKRLLGLARSLRSLQVNDRLMEDLKSLGYVK